MPVRTLMMMLEKSRMGKLELLKKMRFMSMRQRQEPVMLAMRREIQAKSNKSGEGRAAETPG